MKIPRTVLLAGWFFLSCGAGYVCWLLSIGQEVNRVNWGFATFFSWGVERILGIQLEVEGREHLEAHRPCVFVGNHQSALDLAFFGKLVGLGTVSIGKRELIWVPAFGPIFLLGGNITIRRERHRHALGGITEAAQAIRERGVSVIVFPEGTRNKTGGEELLLPFKRGAFYIAVKAGVPIVPIVCSPHQDLLNGASPGRRVVRIRVLPPIETAGKTERDLGSLPHQAQERMREALRSMLEQESGLSLQPPGKAQG